MRHLLLDGAIGTELARRGVDVARPHWSAAAIIESPALLGQLHGEYIRAGAQILTANTFRTTRRALRAAGVENDSAALTRQAVDIATRAVVESGESVLIAGSIAPLEDCYQPDQTPSDAVCRDEHAEHINHLIDGGVDLLLIETMPTVQEALAAVEVACNQADAQHVILSCMCQHAGKPGTLLDGSSMQPLVEAAIDMGILAIGVNCVAAPNVEPHVAWLLDCVGSSCQIIAYGNTGRLHDDDRWEATDAADPQVYAGYAMRWLGAGASIVGGCCGTTPATIAAVREAMIRDGCYGGHDVRS